MIVGVIRRKPVLTHASIVCEGMLASVNSVNSVKLRCSVIITVFSTDDEDQWRGHQWCVWTPYETQQPSHQRTTAVFQLLYRFVVAQASKQIKPISDTEILKHNWRYRHDYDRSHNRCSWTTPADTWSRDYQVQKCIRLIVFAPKLVQRWRTSTSMRCK